MFYVIKNDTTRRSLKETILGKIVLVHYETK